ERGPAKSTAAPTTVAPSNIAQTTVPTSAALPVPGDFRLNLVITEQQCFGSAGCVIHYTFDPEYVGYATPSKSADFLVVYHVTGSDQPQTGNIRVSGGQFHWDRDRHPGPRGCESGRNTSAGHRELTSVP